MWTQSSLRRPHETQYQLAKRALERDLHVLIGEPIADERQRCSELVRLAQNRSRVLHVGKPFLHTPMVQRFRGIVRQRELGEVRYIASRRLSSGSHGPNPIVDLASRDVTMIMFLLNSLPTTVMCSGLDPWISGMHNVHNLVMQFPGDRIGVVHISRMDPRSEHSLTVAGDEKTAFFDELDPNKLRIYNTGVEAPSDRADFVVTDLVSGTPTTSSLYSREFERIRSECAQFIECIEQGYRPRTAENGLQVMQILESAEQSLREGGKPIPVRSSTQDTIDLSKYGSFRRSRFDDNRRF